MSQTITFFYQPNRLRKSESAFVQALQSLYPNSETLNQHFLVDVGMMDQVVDVRNLIGWLKKDSYLPERKRRACIELLEKFSSEFIRVARQPSEISFDVVAQVGSEIYFWEFHERQHSSLSVDRPRHVYTTDKEAIEVPRYLQRLIRDVWRVCYFRRFTVVWKNWFETSASVDEALRFSEGFREFHIDGKFSFKHFIREG